MVRIVATGRERGSGSSKRRGMTLIELLVTLVVILLLSAALFWMLFAGSTIYESSLTRVSGRQDLQVITRDVTDDLQYSSVGLITISPGSPRAFGFLSAFDRSGNFVVDAEGIPVWQKCIVYYTPSGTTRLLRREVYGTFTGAPTSAQLVSYCDGSGRQLSSSVAAMSLVPQPAGKSALLNITIQNVNRRGNIDRQSGRATILFFN